MLTLFIVLLHLVAGCPDFPDHLLFTDGRPDHPAGDRAGPERVADAASEIAAHADLTPADRWPELAAEAGVDSPGSDAPGADVKVATEAAAPDKAAPVPDKALPDTAPAADSAQQVLVADSMADFSLTQGGKGWYYGYYDVDQDALSGNGTYEHADFVQMTETSLALSIWYVDSSCYWTQIKQKEAHPNAKVTGSTYSATEHWAIRRWVSTINGKVKITGSLAKSILGKGGDGVTGKVIVDGTQLYSKLLSGTDTTGVAFVLCATLKKGSIVDLALTAGGSKNADMDTTVFFAEIWLSPATCS